MRYYFTVSKIDGGFIIDSVSLNYENLRNKFPDEKIYYSDKSILSIYITKEQLNEMPKQ